MNKRELIERQFMNEMVTPKMRTMETDNEIDKYVNKLESIMWKGLGFSLLGVIIFLIVLVILK